MPNRVRIISPRNSAQWDDMISDIVGRKAHGDEHEYFGIGDQERADTVRRALRTAGKHLGVSVKAFWKECPAKRASRTCSLGGSDCEYHVFYTVYDTNEARQYKERMASQAANTR